MTQLLAAPGSLLRTGAAGGRSVGPATTPATRSTGRRPSRHTRAASTAVSTVCPELAVLANCDVVSVARGASITAASLVSHSQKTLLLFLTHAADFDSFELAGKLLDRLDALQALSVSVACVLLASPTAAAAFAGHTRLPVSLLYADERGACYSALGFSPGAGRPGGEAPWLSGAGGFAKLMAMCAGIGSPGTLREVIRGYTGDRSAPEVFAEGTAADDPSLRKAFAVLGIGYQRPFELATARGKNMLTVLGDWKTLAPADPEMLVQRGGALLFVDGAVAWRHDDEGILRYANLDDAIAACRSA